VIEAKPTSGFLVETAPPPAFAVTVLYTNVRATLAALRRAASLARDLGATIRILNIRTVPYPLPLDKPPVDREVVARNISTLADGQPIPTRIEICFGRDVVESLLQSLSPNSIVLVGSKSRWWENKERKLAKQLARHGHQIILVAERKEL
jgi:hypothetical protein